MKQFATDTVIGRDKTGVIARVTNFLFEQHANIEALEEQVTRGQFSMTLQASWKRGALEAASLRAGLDRLARELGMEIKLRLTDPRSRQRFALMVTKEMHCFDALMKAKLPADAALVIGNHAAFAPLAQRQRLPFVHVDWQDRAKSEARTLELLEELLMQYDGTLFIVSHDRTFLDNVVTQVIAFEGDGKLMEYVGGYEDWVRVKKFEAARKSSVTTPSKPAAKAVVEKPKTSAKLSFKEQRELDEMPQRIEVLEREQEEITAALGAGALFRDNPSHAKQLQQRATEIENELLQLMARWEELESK